MRFPNFFAATSDLVLDKDAEINIDPVVVHMQCGFCDAQHLDSIIFQTPRTSVWTLSKDRRPVPEVKCKKCSSLQMLGRSRKGCPHV